MYAPTTCPVSDAHRAQAPAVIEHLIRISAQASRYNSAYRAMKRAFVAERSPPSADAMSAEIEGPNSCRLVSAQENITAMCWSGPHLVTS